MFLFSLFNPYAFFIPRFTFELILFCSLPGSPNFQVPLHDDVQARGHINVIGFYLVWIENLIPFALDAEVAVVAVIIHTVFVCSGVGVIGHYSTNYSKNC